MTFKEKYINLFTDFGFKRVFGEVANFGKQEQEAYQQSLKYLRDMHNVVNTARREGEQVGLEIGLEKGEQIGLEKGERKKAIETACKLKKLGTMDNQEISKIVGLSIDEIENLDC